MLNINNIPAPTDVKRNFGVYGRVRVIEGDHINWEEGMINHRNEKENVLQGKGGQVEGDKEDEPREG